jgi:hypothetical protein
MRAQTGREGKRKKRKENLKKNRHRKVSAMERNIRVGDRQMTGRVENNGRQNDSVME